MPTERFNACDSNDLADLLVIWPQQDELAGQTPHIAKPDTPYVELAPIAQPGCDGGIYLCPDGESKRKMGLGEKDNGIGPVRTSLDRAGVNRLITTLRQARDEAFGKDA